MKNIISGIYCIKNTKNGKIYIGSSKDINRRFTTHRYFLNKNIHHCEHLQRSWKKYGKDFFIFEIIEIVIDSELLEKREQFWIDNCKSLYNSCKIAGNKSGYKLSEETKIKISIANTGRIMSDKQKKILSEINLGKKYNNETCEKIGKGHLGLKYNYTDEEKKKIGERLRPYCINGLKKGTKFSDNARKNISESHKGLIQTKETVEKRAKANKKPISQYDKEMNFIRDWDSIKEAGETLNIRRSFISSVLTENKKTAKGFIFKYK